MRIYGTIYVAMHGPVKLLRQAAELLEGGWHEEDKAVREHLLAETKGADGEEIAVAYWEDFRDSNEDLRGYLETLEAVAQKVPGLDIAVAAKVCNSITDSWHYSAYYSPAGSNTLNPDVFDNYCHAFISESGLQLRGKNHANKALSYPLYDEGEWYSLLYEDDLFFDPDCPDEMYETAHEQLEITPALFYVEEYDGDLNLDPCDLDRLTEGGEEMLREVGAAWEELKPYFMVRLDGKKEPEYPLELLTKALRWLFPDDEIQSKLCNGRPYFFAKDGTEFLLGCTMAMTEAREVTEVLWGFPKEAQEWIPIPAEL